MCALGGKKERKKKKRNIFFFCLLTPSLSTIWLLKFWRMWKWESPGKLDAIPPIPRFYVYQCSKPPIIPKMWIPQTVFPCTWIVQRLSITNYSLFHLMCTSTGQVLKLFFFFFMVRKHHPCRVRWTPFFLTSWSQHCAQHVGQQDDTTCLRVDTCSLEGTRWGIWEKTQRAERSRT